MSKTLVVIRSAIQKMSDPALAAIPTPAQQIAFTERFQQRFGLIQPRRINGREQDMDARQEMVKKRRRLIPGVTRAAIDDQVNALRPAIRM